MADMLGYNPPAMTLHNAADDAPLAPHPPLPEYYGDPASRQRWVRKLFDDTGEWYETIIGLLSFGSGGWYRRQALERAGLLAGMNLLDVASGTGVVARAAASLVGRQNVIGLEPSIGMLMAGRRKMRLPAVQAMGERLPFADGSFDVLSIGFALRHLADLRSSFAEWRRVLKPGGTLLIMEITPPRSRVGLWALRFYMNRFLPLVVRLITRSHDTVTLMHYYWDTIEQCVPPQSILEALSSAGFRSVKRNCEMGIFSEYTATA